MNKSRNCATQIPRLSFSQAPLSLAASYVSFRVEHIAMEGDSDADVVFIVNGEFIAIFILVTKLYSLPLHLLSGLLLPTQKLVDQSYAC